MRIAIGAVCGLVAGAMAGGFIGRALVVSGAEHDELTGGYGAAIPGALVGLLLGGIVGLLLSVRKK